MESGACRCGGHVGHRQRAGYVGGVEQQAGSAFLLIGAKSICPCDVAGDGPDTAIVIDALPFSTSGDSTGFTSTVSLGGGPDVFYTFTSAEVRGG